jgi:hypothetical protein
MMVMMMMMMMELPCHISGKTEISPISLSRDSNWATALELETQALRGNQSCHRWWRVLQEKDVNQTLVILRLPAPETRRDHGVISYSNTCCSYCYNLRTWASHKLASLCCLPNATVFSLCVYVYVCVYVCVCMCACARAHIHTPLF